MVCRLCDQEKKLVKAHIIPHAFYGQVSDPKAGTLALTDVDGEYPKKSHSGLYDSTILCGECDSKRIGVYDDYAKKVFVDEQFKTEPIISACKVVGYKTSDLNYANIKLFFISVLWRASVSSQHHFRSVSLGPFEEIARSMILDNNPGSTEEFSVIIYKFSDVDYAMPIPYLDKPDGVNFYKVFLPGYCAFVKVDKRKTPTALRYAQIAANEPIIIISRQFIGSRDGKAASKIARANLGRIKIREPN